MTPPPGKRLEDVFESLEPHGARRERMEARVVATFEREQTSLAAEWLGLLEAGPLLTPLRAAAAATFVVLLTPLGTLAFAVLLLT